jgi:hypothetical protein
LFHTRLRSDRDVSPLIVIHAQKQGPAGLDRAARVGDAPLSPDESQVCLIEKQRLQTIAMQSAARV